MTCGVETVSLDYTIYDLFKDKAEITSVITRTNLGYDLLPGGLNLAGADMDFTQTGREFMLSEALKSVKDN